MVFMVVAPLVFWEHIRLTIALTSTRSTQRTNPMTLPILQIESSLYALNLIGDIETSPARHNGQVTRTAISQCPRQGALIT
jgi:hypothetical protein